MHAQAIANIGYISLFILNFTLLSYTIFQLACLVIRRLKNSHYDNNHGKFRTLVFSFTFPALIVRCLFEGSRIYNYYTYGVADAEPGMLTWVDELPIVIFISIATFFCRFWHRIYSTFSGQERSSKKNKMYIVALFLLNVSLYVFYFGLGVRYYIAENVQNQKDEAWKILVMIMIFLSVTLAAVTIALFIIGRKLYKRTLQLVNYTGRRVKSSKRFLTLYYLLIICCLIKCLQAIFSLIVLQKTAGQRNDILVLLDDQSLANVFFAFYVIIVYVFGESTMFICLLLILNIFANKSQIGGADQMNSSSEGLIHNGSYSESSYIR